jgi:CubicO group peptidase (beta-lactamase class C family)
MKPIRTLLAALAGALLAIPFACAQSSAAAPACQAPVARDLPSGAIDPRTMSIEPFVRLFKKLDEARLDVRAFLVLKDCTVVLERYKEGVTRDHNHSMYSATKSVVSTLVGIQLNDGRLAGLDLPISRLMGRPAGIQDLQWERASTLTLRNAMNMASGFAYTSNPAIHPIYDLNIDRFNFALSLETAAKPGTKFNYSDGDASITGAVVASVAGEDLYAFARRALFDPLQMFNHDWWFRDAAGRYPGGWGLRLRPMDMLKLGQLYIQKGVWNERKMFDARYPAMATTPGASSRYGLHWWIALTSGNTAPDHFAAIGFKGQRLYVFPDIGIVVAIVSSLTGDEETQLAVATLEAIRASVPRFWARSASDTARAELSQLVQSGFRGVTRMKQSSQDVPKAPQKAP